MAHDTSIDIDVSSLDPALERLWFALQDARPWRSLSLLPAQHACETLRLAERLAEVGQGQTEGGIEVVSGLDQADRAPALLARVSAMTAKGSLAIVALAPPTPGSASVAVARRTDACLLCVVLGADSLAQTRTTVALVGRERVVGTVAVERRWG